MKAVIQRVAEASVEVDGEESVAIGKGLLILLGIEQRDELTDVDWLAKKIVRMRIFPDLEGKMNRCLQELKGEALVVSQFTLHASTKRGNRPSFLKAAAAQVSEPLYQTFVLAMETELEKPCATGKFGANMKVSLVNDGPITIIIDSQNRE